MTSPSLVPNSARILPSVFITMRLSVPRHPAWTAATACLRTSANRMGTQSAVWMARRRPGRSVMLASPRRGSVAGVSKRWIASEWNCFRVIRGRASAPVAVWRRRRFSWTFSRVSQSVKPRLRTFSFSRGLTPPGAVLKAWISQGSLEKAGTWRSFRLWDVRVVQLVAGAGGTRDLRDGRLGDVLAAGTIA